MKKERVLDGNTGQAASHITRWAYKKDKTTEEVDQKQDGGWK